jgi:hypothetical protein
MMMFVPTAHTAEISMQVLKTNFPGRLTSHFMGITWFTRLPDLVVTD